MADLLNFNEVITLGIKLVGKDADLVVNGNPW